MTDFTMMLAAAEEHVAPQWWTPIFWIAVICLIILTVGSIAVRNETKGTPTNLLTMLAEHAYLFIENMCVSVIGEHGRKYVTIVFTNWIVILISNLFGVFGLFAPTSTLGVTLGMAIVTVMYVQYEGIRSNGPLGYVKHFFGPPLGLPLVLISILLFFIEFISEAAKMVSLSFRLYGNISGEHQVGETLGGLIHVGSFGVPIQALLMPLSVFVALVQALVFTILTCVYLSLMTHHESDGSDVQHAH